MHIFNEKLEHNSLSTHQYALEFQDCPAFFLVTAKSAI